MVRKKLRDNSGFEKSKGEILIQLEVGFTEPKLIPAPQRATEKKEVRINDIEKDHPRGRSR